MRKKSRPRVWHVYIIRCKDDMLYTGITTDLKRRVQAHNSGNGCRYTKYRCPVTLIYSEKRPTRSSALIREAAVKRLTRKKKLALIKINKKLDILYPTMV